MDDASSHGSAANAEMAVAQAAAKYGATTAQLLEALADLLPAGHVLQRAILTA